jgi:hypothetical protein
MIYISLYYNSFNDWLLGYLTALFQTELAHVVRLQTYIRKVLISNRGHGTDYIDPGFLWIFLSSSR